ncbi:MAG TPA: cyclic nucleotide-binding domain-containing protein [Thermoanaerobaculia bacterium]|nr:cyclic nucleotide-binding domain-containing protein [Thermoanaerobaculia bacterium]
MENELSSFIADQFPCMEIDEGAILFREEEPAAGVWLLQSGQLKLLFSNAALRTLDAPATLGTCEVVSGTASTFTAVAATPCRVVFLDKESLLSLIRDDTTKLISVLQAQCAEVDSCYTCLRSIANRDRRREARAQREVRA